MKKLSVAVCALFALSGCMFGFDADVDSSAKTREDHHAEYRSEFGCPMTDDHAAYRECLLNTYYGTHPKTVEMTTNEKGRSVAVVKNETRTSYDKDTDTYKTERVIVIETEEKLVPVPAPVPEPAAPAPIVEETVVQEETVVPEVVEKPVVEEPKTVEPEQAETWWDTYQKEKVTQPEKEVVCPCEDPNDPCPQCFDK